MARVIDQMPEGRGRMNRYPWDEWFNGQAWELVQGEDYNTHPRNMRSTIYMAARSRGLKATVRKNAEGNLCLLAVPESTE